MKTLPARLLAGSALPKNALRSPDGDKQPARWRLVALSVTALLAGTMATPAAQMALADAPAPPSPQGEGITGLLDCFKPTEGMYAFPVTPPITGNGASWYQLFQDPQDGRVYASWNLVANTLDNGADKDLWGFGIELEAITVEDARGNTVTYTPIVIYKQQQGFCRPIGPASIETFHYLVDAGGGGWTGEATCGITLTWEIGVGVKIGLDAGIEAKIQFGGSLSCSATVHLDTESLIYGWGEGSTICGGCLPDPTRQLKGMSDEVVPEDIRP